MKPTLPDSIPAGPIELQRWRESHIDALMDVVAASLPELGQFLTWAITMPARDDELGVLRNVDALFDLGTDWGYGLFEPDGTLVGSSALHRLDPGVCSIGYFVRSDRTGRGYATAAAGALTAAGFEFLADVERIEIHCDVGNVASAAVPRKLGYALTAEVDRPIEAPGHTGRGYVWARARD